jgi:arylsulfatase A-like enzyme
MRAASLRLLPLLTVAACLPAEAVLTPEVASSPRPNLILVMTDDQGAADAGFVGSSVARTPALDALAARGVVLETFYAAAPVCSPTRASCLTGRHPVALGIPNANAGHLPVEVPNLATLLAAEGYRTGHFGKWHLGTLTREVRDSNRGGRTQHSHHYAPPWERGFDTCFSTEAKVPTWDPMVHPETGRPFGTRYWTGPGESVVEDLDGEDARLIVERAQSFVDGALDEGRPFLAVLWFHGPHLPLVAPEAATEPWAGSADATYHAVVAGIDAQVGRLWDRLEQRGAARDTLLWFCSDNGPERAPGQDDRLSAEAYGRHPYGSAAPFRGRKRSVHEGGLRTPAFVVWPAGLPAGLRVSQPGVTTDQLPTLLSLLGLPLPDALDGVSLAPLLRGEPWRRTQPIPFLSGRRRALVDWPWKLVQDGGGTAGLYHLEEDPGETRDRTPEHAGLAKRMRDALARESERLTPPSGGDREVPGSRPPEAGR